ncbi:MAG: hypothetical protein PHY80_00240 [Rickettsiales bacterium]|nr:hypothetical protein [Rickettsiales bacterium]
MEKKLKPIIAMLAGPNGSGKSTLVRTFLKINPIVFINSDCIARKIIYFAQGNLSLETELIELGKLFYEKKAYKTAQSNLAKKFYERDEGRSIVAHITEEYITGNPYGKTLYEYLQREIDPKASILTRDHYLLAGVNLNAAQISDELKYFYIKNKASFAVAEYGGLAFETAMSNLKSIEYLLAAKQVGFNTHTIYVTTSNLGINIERVQKRVTEQGEHNIDPETIRKRYNSSSQLISDAILTSDTATVVDTTDFKNIKKIDFDLEQKPLERMNSLQKFLIEGKFPNATIEAVLNKMSKIAKSEKTSKDTQKGKSLLRF